MAKTPFLCVALAGVMLSAAPVAAQDFDSDGYRSARYRAPVQADPAPARQISLDAALKFESDKDALFLDVMPTEGGVRDEVTGQWRLSASHETIPGAQWHPDAGRAPVDRTLWSALAASVVAARQSSPDLPVIVFCRSDCWMSWNAARRLADEGFQNIFWLAEGTDGWHERGRKLVIANPIVVPYRTCN